VARTEQAGCHGTPIPLLMRDRRAFEARIKKAERQLKPCHDNLLALVDERAALECHDIYRSVLAANTRTMPPVHRLPWAYVQGTKPPRHVSRYTDAEIELGLRAVAIASGNERKASTLLARQVTCERLASSRRGER
jgi:hypothetical protein